MLKAIKVDHSCDPQWCGPVIEDTLADTQTPGWFTVFWWFSRLQDFGVGDKRSLCCHSLRGIRCEWSLESKSVICAISSSLMRCSNEMLPLYCVWQRCLFVICRARSFPSWKTCIVPSDFGDPEPFLVEDLWPLIWFWVVQHPFLSTWESTLLAVSKQEPSQ